METNEAVKNEVGRVLRQNMRLAQAEIYFAMAKKCLMSPDEEIEVRPVPLPPEKIPATWTREHRRNRTRDGASLAADGRAT